jgi:LysM repeat protein
MGAKRMQGHRILGLFLAVAVLAGCHSAASKPEAAPPSAVVANEPTVEGTVVGDDKTAMEAAIDAGASRTETTEVPRRGVPLAENAPDSYVVKRGDTLWGIAKVFLRDPWYWPEIWQVNPQVHNPHLIYPGDTLRLVYIDGQPQIVLQRGDGVRVEPRVRSEPIDSAITTIPYATVAAFMSKPTVTKSRPRPMSSRPATCTW